MNKPNFSTALEILELLESGYSNTATDLGGETVCGISRRFWPNWEGWHLVDRVDAATKKRSMKEWGEAYEALHMMAQMFYRRYFWDTIQGSQQPSHRVAEKVFDVAINCGVVTAVKFLQTALNFLNKQGTLYQDLYVDGVFGPLTLKSLYDVFRVKPQWMTEDDCENVIITLIEGQQTCHYISVARATLRQEANAWGWVNRIIKERKRLEA